MVTQHDTMVDRLIQWEAGQTPGPWRVVLIPTNRCNLACRMCWRQWVESEGGHVDDSEVGDERLLRLVEEAAALGVKEWVITGGGEPMTRSSLLIALCRRIRECGMNGSMNTNGTLWNKERFEELIRIGWDHLLFSMDGPDAQTNDDIRSPGSFERTKKNLLLLSDLKRASGAQFPKATLCSVVTRSNCDTFDRMVRFAAETGCAEGVALSSLVLYGDETRRMQLTPEETDRLRQHVRKASELAEQLGVTHNFGEFLSVLDDAPPRETASPHTGFLGATCFEAWLTATIFQNGRISPCCQFWEETADSINDKTLAEVWLGPYMQDRRKKLVARTGLPWNCKQCTTPLRLRTQQFREVLTSREWDRWGALSWQQRIEFLAARVGKNLREYGLRGTARRAREWTQLRLRR